MYERLLQSIEHNLITIANRGRRPAQPQSVREVAEGDAASGDVLIGHERNTSWKPGSRATRQVYLSKEELGKHIALHARTGAGKSVAILNLVKGWIRAGNGLIVFDPDGSQAPQIAALLSQQSGPDSVGDRLLYVDLDDADSIVPLDVLAGADESCALLVLDAIEQQWGAAFGPVVGRSMRAAIFTAVRAGLTLGDIPLLFQSEALRARVFPTADAASQRFWTEYGAMTAEQQRAYRDPVVNRLEAWLSASTIAAMLSYPRGLDFRALFARRPDLCVVVNLACRRAAGASRLLAALLWSQILSQLMHPDRVNPGVQPILVVADEYQNLASETAMMTCLAEARKYRVSLCLATQTFSRQSAAMRDTVLGNCFCTFAFSSGDANDFAPYVHFPGDPLSRTEIAAFLARQKTGESVLIRPGLPSVPVKHLPPPPEVTKANPAAVRALIEASYRAFAVPRAQALQEISERQARLVAADTAVQSDAVAPASAPVAKPVTTPARRTTKRPLLNADKENPDA